MKTTTKTDKNQKISRKVREESVEAIYAKNCFTENFISDPLNNFPKPVEAIFFWIM